MTDHAWKQFERRVAKRFGGQRRGADYRDSEGGKNDVIVDGWSIECKLLGRPSLWAMQIACAQAESAAQPHDIPIAIVKKKGQHDDNALVVMRLEQFQEWFCD